MDPAEEFLNSMPPNWVKAEQHGRANMVVFNTVLNPENKNDFCECCKLAHPTGENFKNLCCEVSELGEIGPGYPMLLNLIKLIGYLMLFLTFIYALPSCYLIIRSFE